MADLMGARIARAWLSGRERHPCNMCLHRAALAQEREWRAEALDNNKNDCPMRAEAVG